MSINDVNGPVYTPVREPSIGTPLTCTRDGVISVVRTASDEAPKETPAKKEGT